MKTSKCLMGVLLSAVLLFGSAFAANTLHKDGIAIKDGFNMKGHSFHNDAQTSSTLSLRGPAHGNGDRDCADCEFDWSAYGSECCDSAWDEYGIDCATLEGTYGWDCAGCACPGDGPAECGDGNCTGDETYDTCPEDCNAPGECDAGYITDCVDDDCCPESWIGDGFEDCEDQAYGCDLTCYDDDGGDCAPTQSCEEQGLITCDDGSCAATAEDCPEPGECDAGYIQDCVDADCCPESWIGDGFEDCEDQAYGCDLTCYDNDGGDCAPACPDGEVECWDGSCAASEGDCPDAPDCSSSFMVYGSDPTGEIWDGNCYSDGSAYYLLDWEGGCLATNLAWEDETGYANSMDISSYGFVDGFVFYGFNPGGSIVVNMTFEGNISADGAADADCTGDESCADIGMIDDCADDDCCPESWIGDGFEDCEDQAYGCDLTCYDNDGGDCDGSTDTGGTTGGTSDCDDCEFDWSAYGSECCDTAWDEYGIDCATLEGTYGWDCAGCNCPGDGGTDGGTDGGDCDAGYIEDCADDDCCPESWIGDGFEDCEDQAYGCDLTCYDNDGGDCPDACEGYTCWDGSCVDSEADCPDAPEVPEPTGVCIAGENYAGYPAVTVSWDISTECGDGVCNGDETYDNCPDDCTAPGECDPGYVTDCVDDDCCPESWIGDGFEDCEDQAYGCDLTCYDNDGGDCDGSTTTGGTTGGTESCDDCEFDWSAYGSECCDTAWDEYGIDCATLESTYGWDCAGCGCPGDGDPVCGDGVCNGDEDYMTCPDDCNEPGECDAGYIIDCADDDCCPESWIGDGFEDCEDQAYGCDLTCYDNDGGDCDGSTTTGGTTGGTESCDDCEFDWSAYGSECCDTAWDEYGISCAALEADYNWDCSGCNCPGDGDPVCGDGFCTGDETYENCPDDCLPPGECADGQIADCADDDCCPESWIGDGFEDCEDQAYGCDLTCYDNDGGDCGETVSCEEQGLIECMDGSCAATAEECDACPAGTVADCSGDGDCCYETWVGDGYCDGEDQAYGCDLLCYEEDGGDCDGGRSVVVRTFNKGEALGISQANTVSRMVKADKQPIVNLASMRDGEVIHNSGDAVRVGQEINTSSRALMATVALSCDACLYGESWEGAWEVEALAFGYFTVYGFDDGADVCGTVTFCDGGACSDTSDEVCAVSGDASSVDCAEDDGCDGAGSGDVNGDGSADVLDIVQIVNVILGGSFADDCAAEAADMNGDGSADVLDIVQIVNGILGRSDVGDATTGKLIRDNGALMLEANGYIGGVQMTLKHGANFTLKLTENALVADSRTVGNETKLVIVAPEGEELFTFAGDFEIVDMIVANSQDRVNVGAPTAFSLSEAYPNPFNPTTSMTLAVPQAGNVSVQVYNIMGQVVATLASGHMDASTYTLTWDASDASSGMYFVKAEAAGSVTTQKLVLMK